MIDNVSDLSRLWPPLADMDCFRATSKRRDRVAFQECFHVVEVDEVKVRSWLVISSRAAGGGREFGGKDVRGGRGG